LSKKPAVKRLNGKVWENSRWTVHSGRLVPGRGRPEQVTHLFKVVAEKVPFAALKSIRDDMRKQGIDAQGVYIAHDSMGFARYAGRGNIFARLRARKNAQKLELVYFSFYVIKAKKHEREIETMLIRVASPLLSFNSRKVRASVLPGNLMDYEAGTNFYERQYKKGRKLQGVDE